MIKKESDKDDTLALAQDILGKAHPDAVSVIRHWITIIQSRWEEVMAWANQVYLFILGIILNTVLVPLPITNKFTYQFVPQLKMNF